MNPKKPPVDKPFRESPKKLGPDEALITTWDRFGKPFQYVAVGRVKG
jgi:hypothetical protein